MREGEMGQDGALRGVRIRPLNLKLPPASFEPALDTAQQCTLTVPTQIRNVLLMKGFDKFI